MYLFRSRSISEVFNGMIFIFIGLFFAIIVTMAKMANNADLR